MSSLGIPANLQAICDNPGIINLSWGDTPPTCDPYFTCSSGNCDEVLKSSSKTWTLNNSLGTIFWEVSGTDASINQDGVVTTTGVACGMLTITATDSCCGVYTQQVRVTDGGAWFLQSEVVASCPTPPCPWGGDCPSYTGILRTSISGNTKITQVELCYNGGVSDECLATANLGNPIFDCTTTPPNIYTIVWDRNTYLWCCPGGC